MKTAVQTILRLVPFYIVLLFVLPAVAAPAVPSVPAAPAVPPVPRPTDENFTIIIEPGDLHGGFISGHLGCTIEVDSNVNETIQINAHMIAEVYDRDGAFPVYQDWTGTISNHQGRYWSFLIEDNHRVSLIRVTATVNDRVVARIGICFGPLVFFFLGQLSS